MLYDYEEYVNVEKIVPELSCDDILLAILIETDILPE